MKYLLMISFMMLMTGCVNLYTRCPITKVRITETYQCTEQSVAFSTVIMFPQIMNPSGSNELYMENIITIPLGICCFADVVCEVVIDTVLYPVDYFIVKSRKDDGN